MTARGVRRGAAHAAAGLTAVLLCAVSVLGMRESFSGDNVAAGVVLLNTPVSVS